MENIRHPVRPYLLDLASHVELRLGPISFAKLNRLAVVLVRVVAARKLAIVAVQHIEAGIALARTEERPVLAFQDRELATHLRAGTSDDARIDIGDLLPLGKRIVAHGFNVVDILVRHFAVLVADKIRPRPGIEDGLGYGVVKTSATVLHARPEVALDHHGTAILRPLPDLQPIAARLGLAGRAAPLVVCEDVEIEPRVNSRPFLGIDVKPVVHPDLVRGFAFSICCGKLVHIRIDAVLLEPGKICIICLVPTDGVAHILRRVHFPVGVQTVAEIYAAVWMFRISIRSVARGEECSVAEFHPLDLALGLGVPAADDAGIDILRSCRLDVPHPFVGLFGERRAHN